MGGEGFYAHHTHGRSRQRRRVSWVVLLAILALAGVVPASASEASGAAAWGENADGQLGNDTTTTEKEPVAVKVLTEATAVAGGELHSLALLKTGKVMAWGDNADGQLGNGTTTTEKEPVEVKGLTEVIAIAAGADHSLALLKSGKVMAWGDNVDGQLGNGTTTTEKEPVEVKGLSEVVAIAAGSDHSLAVLKSGKVKAWGDNNDGQLGNGTTTTEKEPVEVKGLSEAIAVAGGEFHSLALLASGKVKAWGDNNDGQLGNDTTTTEKEPVEVKGLSEAIAVAAGHSHSLAVLKSGKVKGWGDNNDGQLGNGTTTNEEEPVEVKGLSEAIAVAGGEFHSLALLASGKVKAWGDNADGQLGNDSTTTEKEPVEVTGLSRIAGISAGADFSLAAYAIAPANTALPVISGEAKDEKTLSTSTGTWSGSPTITYSYQWESCNSKGESCSSISGATAASYTVAHEEVGDTIRVKVTAKNSAGEASASSAQTAAVVASAPVNTALPVVSGEAKDERTLSASTGSWSGTPTITYAYQWEGCNTAGEGCSSISGATAASYTVAHEEVGDTIRVKVTAKNSAGEASASSAQTAAVVASAPVNTALPVVSGEAKDERTLSASTGSWSGTPTITYAYQWEGCNTAGEGCSSISGATAASYTVAHEEVGDTIRVKVTAKNSAGEASASSAQTATVLASAPANTALPVVSGEAKDERTLSASTGSWSGTPTITYAYQWEGCNTAGESCSSISGATAASYTIAHEEVGHTLRVKVTAKNSGGEASVSSAQTAAVVASAPVNTALPVVSGEAKDERTLSASAGVWSGSPTITYAYQWESCNTAGEGCLSISGATGSSYTVAHEEVGDTVRVKVTAKNSVGEASVSSAQTLAVVASAPVNTALPVVSGEAKDERTLSASAGVWSGSPTITYAYQWESCNTAGEGCLSISGATAASYTVTHEEVGDTIRVKVTAKNSAGEALASSAQTATVAASAPANTALPVISGEAKQSKTLSASTGSWTGTSPLSYAFQWQSCNSLGVGCLTVSGATSATHLLGASEVGGTLRVAVTASNAGGSASTTSEATGVIAESLCTDTWTGANEGAWQVPGYWSTGSVPGPSDVACIEAGTTVDVTGGTSQVGVLKAADASLKITGGSLETTNTSKTSEVGTLILGGGTLGVSGVLDVSGSFVVDGAVSVDGSGRLVVGSGVLGSIGDGSGCSAHLALSGVTFANEGTLTFGVAGGVAAGAIAMQEGARFENSGTFNDDSYDSGCGYGVGGDSYAIYGTGGAASVVNTGSFVADAGSDTLVVAVPFSNEGTVEAHSGTLNLSDGGSGSSGMWAAGSGATLGFTGGAFSLSGATWSGSGMIAVAGGAVTASGLKASGASASLTGGSLTIPEGSTTSVAGLSLGGGTLGVSGVLDVSGSFVVDGAVSVDGSGRLVVGSGVLGSIGDGSGCSAHLALSGVTFANEGTLTFGVAGGVAAGAIAMQEGARFENSGTFNDDSYDSGCGYGVGGDSYAIYGTGGAASVVNTGSFVADAGSDTLVVAVPFSNEGTVEAHSGTLNLSDGGSGSSGMWAAGSGATLGFTGGAFSLSGATWSGSGMIAVAGGAVTASGLKASGASASLTGGSLTIPEGSTTSVAGLSLGGGTLGVSGVLDVSGSFVVDGAVSVDGSGRLVVGSGVLGSIGDGSGCSAHLALSGVTFANEGTLTFGVAGGVAAGAIAMQEGARFENSGTFNDDSYDSGCGYGVGGDSYAIYGTGGAASVVNTGSFVADAGSDTLVVAVPFSNEGTVEAHSGTLDFHDGGIPEQVARGAWRVEGDGAIVLTGGEFLIGEDVNLFAVRVEGATITRVPTSGPPRGSLNPHPYASGTVTISGSGKSVGSGFSAAAIEVTPSGHDEWKSLCGPLTPGLLGEFQLRMGDRRRVISRRRLPATCPVDRQHKPIRNRTHLNGHSPGRQHGAHRHGVRAWRPCRPRDGFWHRERQHLGRRGLAAADRSRRLVRMGQRMPVAGRRSQRRHLSVHRGRLLLC